MQEKNGAQNQETPLKAKGLRAQKHLRWRESMLGGAVDIKNKKQTPYKPLKKEYYWKMTSDILFGSLFSSSIIYLCDSWWFMGTHYLKCEFELSDLSSLTFVTIFQKQENQEPVDLVQMFVLFWFMDINRLKWEF